MRKLSFLMLCACLLISTLALSQAMDAQLNLAKRNLVQLESELRTLKTGDVTAYNRLGQKLTKTAELIQNSTSQSHPDYAQSIEKWRAIQSEMSDIATRWQNTTNQQQDTNPQVKSSAESTGQQSAHHNTSVVDANQILAKYQRENRPALSNNATPEEAYAWALKMRALQSTELEKDMAILESGKVSQQDANRVSRWINGEFQNQISSDIEQTFEQQIGRVTEAVILARQIANIPPTDKIKEYNFAQGENGKRNAQTLSDGMLASAIGLKLEEVYPQLKNPNRQAHIAEIAMAQSRFDDMVAGVSQTQQELAATPKKTKPRKTAFLQGIEQELWYRGGVIATVDAKGNVWLGSDDVGDITSDGNIWVRGNDLGSIEPDGKVWFRGNHIGTLEDNGKVWRGSSQVGLIEDNGKVWIDGNANGEIVPFNGEWKRAAVVYFFKDIFE